MIKLGLLGSTRGTHLLSLRSAIEKGLICASIEVVISDREHALILERARGLGIPAQFIDVKNFSRSEFDSKLTECLKKAEVDLVLLIGYMRILSKEFVSTWKNKVLNVHPSLLPAFAGKMDTSVHQAVLDSGVSQTGCTVHHVTDELDAGPIIVQKTCDILESDTLETLKAKVQELEGLALIEAIKKFTPDSIMKKNTICSYKIS